MQLREWTVHTQVWHSVVHTQLLDRKKSRIRETKHLSTDADSSTNTTVGWTKNSQKPIFLKNGKNHLKRKNSKMSRDMPKLTIYPLTRGLSAIGKRGFQHVLYGKIRRKKTFFYAAILDHFQNKMVKSENTFSQGFQISKIFGHPTSGSGGKKTFERYLKSEQTDRRTHGQTHRQTHGHFDL